MNLLFLAYYFPPLGGMGSIRARSFLRYLPEAGVEVTAVAPRTGTYGHDASLTVPAGARVVRTGTLEPGVLLRPSWRATGAAPVAAGPGGGGAARRLAKRAFQFLFHVPDPNVGWVPAAVRAGLSVAARWRPDAVLSSSPPMSAHLAAAIVASRLRRPHFADVRDYPHCQRPFRGLRARLDEALERRALRGARGVTSPSRGILEYLAARVRAPGLIVRNGWDEADFAGPPPPPPGVFRIVHVGTTYARFVDHRPLLRAARRLASEGVPVRLRFVGVVDDCLRALFVEEGVADLVELTGFVPHALAIAEMRAASAILLTFCWGERAEDMVVVGKTFECLRAGPPALALGRPGCEGERLVREAGGAEFRDPSDESGIHAALAGFAAGRCPPPADPARLAAYTRREQARRLAAFLHSLVGSPR